MTRKDIFKERLKMARTKEGISLDKLSDKINRLVSKQALSKYELGTNFPSSSIILALAKALNVSIDYFFRPIVVSMEDTEISFRKKQSLSATDEKKIKGDVADKIEKYIQIESILEIENMFSNPIKDIQINKTEDIYHAVNELRTHWHINAPIADIVSIIERKGIKVIFINDVKKFDGLCGHFNNIPFIIVKQCENSERQRFTLLHELGHLLLSISNEVDLDKEKVCDLFASELLLPQSIIEEAIGKKRKNVTLTELCVLRNSYGISIDAILYRLKQLDIISDSSHLNWMKAKNSRPNLKAEIERSVSSKEVSDQFNALVMRALSENRITISKAADLMNVSIYKIQDEML